MTPHETDLRQLFDENPSATFLASLDGRVEACNAAFARLFGFKSAADAQGINLGTLYPADVLAPRLTQLRAGARLPQEIVEVRRLDGQPLRVLDRLVGRVDAQGTLIGIAGFLLDDTPRQTMHAQLQHALKMAQVGRLAGGVAHDFNNLLMIMIGLTEGVLEQLGPEDVLRPELEQVLDAGRRGAALAAQILAFSRKPVSHPATFDVDEAVEAARPLIARLLGNRVTLEISRSAEPKWVQADRHQFEQVLLNLATNAHDAMPNGGRVVIETVVARPPACRDCGLHVYLRVIDSGSGISAETQAHIFEPFFTTKAQGKGTGLGLAQVHAIVTEQGGVIEVESTEGIGTAFTIRLPLAAAPPTAGAEAPAIASGQPQGAETILVVDDEAPVLALVSGALRRLGYQVLVAEHAAAALSIAQTQAASLRLLITDVVLPGHSGRDLAQDIVARLPRLPVLFMSGYPEHVLDLNAAGVRGAGFLHKPFTLDMLGVRVREMLDLDLQAQAVGDAAVSS